MKKIVTHATARFHSDDVFSVAVFDLLYKGNVEVFRTHDPAIIASADIVVDIGGIYDEQTNRFDHHQRGGAGERENGIQYASIGLVWKHYGEELCGSKEASEVIDKKLIQPLDAGDNGQTLFDLRGDTNPYLIHDVVNLYRDYDGDEEQSLQSFLKAVYFARFVLEKEIEYAKKYVSAKKQAHDIYHKTQDKRIIIFDDENHSSGSRTHALQEFPEPMFIIYPDQGRNSWRVKGVNSKSYGFEVRKAFPESWGGLKDIELQKISGIEEATFCHRGLFTCATINKEGAIKTAEKALEL